MKKILSVFIALVLVFALCAMPASAETNKAEWKKGAGAATFNFSDEGTKITLEEGTSFIHYQKKVNLRDFTIKVVFNAPEDYWEWGWFAITIGGTGKYSGDIGAQNNIVIFPRGVGNICINPQILHSGQSTITPQSRVFKGDFIATELTIRFQKVADYIYSISINDEFSFEYSIPENFDWVEDVNGEGCVGFGGTIDLGKSSGHPDGAFNILIKEIAGTKVNGQPISANDTSNSGSNNNTNTGNSGNSDSNIDADTGINQGIIGGDDTTNTTTDDVAEESDNTLLIVIIICGAVLLLAAIAAVIVIVLLKSKKATVPAEEVAEEAEETTEE